MKLQAVVVFSNCGGPFQDLWIYGLSCVLSRTARLPLNPFALTSSCYSPMLKPIEAGLVCPGSEPGLGFVDQGLGCIDVVSQDSGSWFLYKSCRRVESRNC